MIFAAMFGYAFSDIFHYGWQPVAANVRMRVHQYVRVCPERHQLIQHLPDITPLGRSGEKLAVGKGPGSALSETIIRIRVHLPLPGQCSHIELSPVYILATFQYDRFQPSHQQSESSEHACRTGSDDSHRLGHGNIPVLPHPVFLKIIAFGKSLDPVPVQNLSSRIHRPLRYTVMCHSPGPDSHGLRCSRQYLFFFRYFAYRQCHLKFFHDENRLSGKQEPHPEMSFPRSDNENIRQWLSWQHCP